MRYVDALKIWNQTENNGKWCFPSKDTESHKQILQIQKNGEAPKKGPNKRIIKVKKRTKKKQVGGMSIWDMPEFRNEFKKHTPADLRQMGYGMDGNGMSDTERNSRIRSLFKNTYGQDALDNYDKQQGNGMILPGRQQRGKGADLPWDVILDVAQNPMSYINKAGKFLDSQSGTKQMALQIERETGAKRLFKWPWE